MLLGPMASTEWPMRGGDGDAMGLGEIAVCHRWPSGMGAGNGPYSPQEIFFDASDVGYLHNSSTNLHGIFQFADGNASGRADDAGLRVLRIGTAAEPLRRDCSARFRHGTPVAHIGSMLFQQTATGASIRSTRIIDVNIDLDANDAGEGGNIYENVASGFTGVDILSLTNGDVLITDNSGITVGNCVQQRRRRFPGRWRILQHDQRRGVRPERGRSTSCRRPGRCEWMDSSTSTTCCWSSTTGAPAAACCASDIDCGQTDINDLLMIVNNWELITLTHVLRQVP